MNISVVVLTVLKKESILESCWNSTRNCLVFFFFFVFCEHINLIYPISLFIIGILARSFKKAYKKIKKPRLVIKINYSGIFPFWEKTMVDFKWIFPFWIKSTLIEPKWRIFVKYRLLDSGFWKMIDILEILTKIQQKLGKWELLTDDWLHSRNLEKEKNMLKSFSNVKGLELTNVF